MNCTVAIAADLEAELLEAAVQHAVAVHGHNDTPELREAIRSVMHTGMHLRKLRRRQIDE